MLPNVYQNWGNQHILLSLSFIEINSGPSAANALSGWCIWNPSIWIRMAANEIWRNVFVELSIEISSDSSEHQCLSCAQSNPHALTKVLNISELADTSVYMYIADSTVIRDMQPRIHQKFVTLGTVCFSETSASNTTLVMECRLLRIDEWYFQAGLLASNCIPGSVRMIDLSNYIAAKNLKSLHSKARDIQTTLKNHPFLVTSHCFFIFLFQLKLLVIPICEFEYPRFDI
jgi:hypothetical protein